MVQRREVLSKNITCAIVGLSRATIWRLEGKGEFPARLQLSAGRVGYLRCDVEQWLAERPRV